MFFKKSSPAFNLFRMQGNLRENFHWDCPGRCVDVSSFPDFPGLTSLRAHHSFRRWCMKIFTLYTQMLCAVVSTPPVPPAALTPFHASKTISDVAAVPSAPIQVVPANPSLPAAATTAGPIPVGPPMCLVPAAMPEHPPILVPAAMPEHPPSLVPAAMPEHPPSLVPASLMELADFCEFVSKKKCVFVKSQCLQQFPQVHLPRHPTHPGGQHAGCHGPVPCYIY
jgi:hypothetical protein